MCALLVVAPPLAAYRRTQGSVTASLAGGNYVFCPRTQHAYAERTTGDVLSVTKHFDNDKFPDVREGMCVKVTMNGWSAFKVDGKLYAIGDARSVIAAYDPADIDA